MYTQVQAAVHLLYPCLTLAGYKPAPFPKAVLYEGSVCRASLSVEPTSSVSVPILHDWFLAPFGAWPEMWDSTSLCRLCFVSAPEQVPRSTPQWVVLQDPHHKSLCRAFATVLSLRPFLLKDSAILLLQESGTFPIQKILHCDLFSKPLLEWCQLGWVLCICRGWEGGLKLFLCASTSCFPASFFEIRTVASLYNKFTKGILEIDFPHVLFKGTYCANTCMSDWSV